MTNLEIAEFIKEKCQNINQIISFLEGDCGIKGISSFEENKFYDELGSFSITVYTYKDKEFCRGDAFIQKLMPLLSPEEQERIRKIVADMQDRAQAQQAQASANNKGGVYIENKNNNETIANASSSASATNFNQITTLTELSAHIESRTDIENKAEIQKLISQLEQAKEDEDQNYLDLLIKLLDLLSKDGIVPPVIAKGVKFIKKCFEKGA